MAAAPRAARVAAACAESAAGIRISCDDTSLTDLRAFYERAAALCEEKEPGAIVTGTRLLEHAGVPPSQKIETEANSNGLLARLRAVTAPDSGWVHAFPADNDVGARLKATSFIGLVRASASLEVEAVALASQAAPPGTPGRHAVVGGGSPHGAPTPPGHTAGALGGRPHLTITNSEEKKVLRLGECMTWLSKHMPPLQDYAPSQTPHREAVTCFDPWNVAEAMPRLPLWSDVTKKLHMQDIPAGRASGVCDLACALIALLTAYACPMPRGIEVSSADSKCTLEYEEVGTDPSTGAPVTTKVTSPPGLAAWAVNKAIAAVYAIGEPLTIEQKDAYAKAYWTCLSTRLTEQSKKSYTRALLLTMEHRDLQDWKSAVRGSTPAPIPAEDLYDRRDYRRDDYRRDDYGGFSRRDEARRDDRRDDRLDDRRGRGDRDWNGRDGSPRKKLTSDERNAMPICADYRAKGRCAAHANGTCKGKRHPGLWANIGEAEYERRKQ